MSDAEYINKLLDRIKYYNPTINQDTSDHSFWPPAETDKNAARNPRYQNLKIISYQFPETTRDTGDDEDLWN